MPILLIATLACCAAALAVALCVLRVEVGLISLFAVELIDLTFGRDATVIGHLHLSGLDGVSVILLVAGAIRFVRGMSILTLPRVLALGYALLFAVSFVRGVNANGVFAAANEARGFVGPLAAMLFFAEAPADKESIRRYIRCYFAFGVGLCLLAVLAIAGLPVGVSAWSSSAAEAAGHRVLPSSAAAVIAICGFFFVAPGARSSGRLALLWPTLFFLTAIYLRHRTVWIMLLAGAALLLIADRRLFRKIAAIMLFALAAVAGLVLMEGDQPGVASQSDFLQSLSSTDTWQWRVNGWQEFLFDSEQTPLTIGIGKPMGSGWWHIDPESHLLQTAPPHSEYVTEYLRVGVLGLLQVLLFAARPVIILIRTHRDTVSDNGNNPSRAIWAVVGLIAMIYGATYSIELESYALLGLATAIANHRPDSTTMKDSLASRPSSFRAAPDFTHRIRRECAHP